MKKIFKIFLLCCTAVCTIMLSNSCKGNANKKLLPNVSGKAGDVLVVVNKTDWEGNLGKDIRDILKQDCPFLPQKEPLYSVAYVIPSNFSQMFKIHRNILNIVIGAEGKEGVIYRNDVWAYPQTVIQINAKSAESADSIFMDNHENILEAIEQAERNRIIANAIKFEASGLADSVATLTGGYLHFPTGFILRKKNADFMWIADEKQFVNQAIFIYKYPAEKQDNFTVENIIKHRNEIMKANVPGMFENTYMTTSEFFMPSVKFMKYNNINFAETRGFWEVENDYMGGPFVSHSFYSQDGKSIIVIESFVYAPKYDKRQYLRQVEALLYSFEWKKNKK